MNDPEMEIVDSPKDNVALSTSGSLFYRFAGLSLAVAAIYFADDVLIPIVVAVLISFLLGPIVRRIERWHVPHSAAVVATVVLALVSFGAVVMLAGRQVINLVEQVPQYEQTFKKRLEYLRNHAPVGLVRAVDILQDVGDETFFPPAETESDEAVAGEDDIVIPVEVRDTQPTLIELIERYVTPALGPLARVGVVAILVLFSLLYSRDLRDRLVMLAGRGGARVTEQALNEAAGRVSGYLLVQFVNNVCYGLLVGLGLWMIGLPGAVFWGLAAMLVRFIPYLGPWLGACLPILLSLGVFGDWMRPAMVVGMFVLLEIVFNNFIEPYLFGAGAGISPIGVIVAMIFWGWVWGGVGLLFAVPLTACLVVAGRYLPQLHIFTILLGGAPGDDTPPTIITASQSESPQTAAQEVIVKPGG